MDTSGPGQTLGHYQLEARIASGGMGEIYRALDTTLNRRVALKLLPKHLATHGTYHTRFQREAKAIAGLNHPNIVTLHSVEEAEGLPFITMELVEGRTLTELIPATGFPLHELLAIAVPLADAVSAAHRNGITHRDLKPDNIMIDDQSRLRVLDFGLAKLQPATTNLNDRDTVSGSVTQEGTILGTVAYMSPEQAEGREVDARSDVFSLGIILYQMATGKRPFQGSSHVSVLSSILKDTPTTVTTVRPGLPRRLGRLIDRCLEKEPEQRFASAEELHAELERLRDEPTRGGGRQGRFLWWIAAAVVTLAAAAGTLILGTRDRGSSGPPEAAARAATSVAVLPFSNLSPDAETDYFSDGMAEEIFGKLSRIESLEVASRTSVARYRDSTVDAREIGRQLGVRYLLEGSVRKAGDRVRISAQLVDAASGFQVWAEDFEGSLDDVFGVQDETALRIAEALDLRLSPLEEQAVRRRYTGNPQAYDAYLRGRALLEYFADPAKLEAARTHMEKALELDPDYPPALVGLSRVEAQYHRNLDPSPDRLVRAENLAKRALELEPRLAETHLALGQVHGNRYEYLQAAERFRQAIRLEPDSAYAWDLLSWALAYQQPPDATGAEHAARKAISLQASLIGAHYHLGRALLLQGRHAEAIEAFEQSKRLDPTFESADFGIAQVHLAQGDAAAALEDLGRIQRMRDTPIVQHLLASVHATEGNHDLALEALERALDANFRDTAALRQNAHLDPLRSDPRFDELLRSHGLEP